MNPLIAEIMKNENACYKGCEIKGGVVGCGYLCFTFQPLWEHWWSII